MGKTFFDRFLTVLSAFLPFFDGFERFFHFL